MCLPCLNMFANSTNVPIYTIFTPKHQIYFDLRPFPISFSLFWQILHTLVVPDCCWSASVICSCWPVVLPEAGSSVPLPSRTEGRWQPWGPGDFEGWRAATGTSSAERTAWPSFLTWRTSYLQHEIDVWGNDQLGKYISACIFPTSVAPCYRPARCRRRDGLSASLPADRAGQAVTACQHSCESYPQFIARTSCRQRRRTFETFSFRQQYVPCNTR